MIATARVVRWLGPWAGAAPPPGVGAVDVEVEAGPRCRVYEATAVPALGVYLLAQGLHHLGADDPRLDRFCRALAASGFLVVAPFLRDFLRLEVRPAAGDDLVAALPVAERLAASRGLARPAVFSISFGSMPAIDLATRPDVRDRIGSLVVFGGFADFGAAVRFAVTGRYEHGGRALSGLSRDPLNTPAVFLNVLRHLEMASTLDVAPVAAAWREVVARTWGRPELKRPGARDATAHHVARGLSPRQRELFLIGCGLAPGAEALLERGLEAAGDGWAFCDPRPRLGHVRAPVILVHGRDDDVIPWPEAEKLRDALPAGHPCELLVTGMAGHTGVGLPALGELAREVVTLLDVARAIAGAPRAERVRSRARPA